MSARAAPGDLFGNHQGCGFAGVADCLNSHWFLTLAGAAEKLVTWRRCDNAVPPNSAIGSEAARHRLKGKPNVAISLVNPGGEPSLLP